jgi:hypothetical protein
MYTVTCRVQLIEVPCGVVSASSTERLGSKAPRKSTQESMSEDPRSMDQGLVYSRIRVQGLCVCASMRSLTQNTVQQSETTGFTVRPAQGPGTKV